MRRTKLTKSIFTFTLCVMLLGIFASSASAIWESVPVSTPGTGFGFDFGDSTTPTPTPSQPQNPASGETGTTTGSINFRTGPGTSYGKVSGCNTVPRGASVTILEKLTGWYKVSYKGYTGYLSSDFVKLSAGSTPVSGNTGITKETVWFRVNPSLSSSRVPECPTIASGQRVEVLAASGSFYQIRYKGYTGYARQVDVELESSSSPAPSPAPSTGIYGITKELVWFRQNPSTSSARVSGCTEIKAGKRVEVLGSSGSFYQIRYNGYTGYARQVDIALEGSTSPSPSPSPTPVPSAPNANVPTTIQLTQEQAQKWAEVPGRLSAVIAGAKYPEDVKGWIYVPGTNIDYPIMFGTGLHGSSWYYDQRNYTGSSDSKGSIYMFYNNMTKITPINGHNMRSSGAMFHQLHDVQNSLKSNPAGNRFFNITMGGYTTWEIFAMYETKATESKTTLQFNSMQPNITGDAFRTWVNYQIGRSEVNLGVNVRDTDNCIVLITCGDNYDSATAQSRLYTFLRSVG